MAELEGVVQRVVYYNPESHYAVLRVEAPGHSRPVPVVGCLPGVRQGEALQFIGEWEDHPQYGRQFRAASAGPIGLTTSEGIERFLRSGVVKGVGPVTARRLVERFGAQTLDVIVSQPERLAEVRGLNARQRQALHEAVKEHQAEGEALAFLHGLGLGPELAHRVWRRYGPGAPAVVRADPYRLAREVSGIGFLTADRLREALGIDKLAPSRADALVLHLLQTAWEEGHACLPVTVLAGQAQAMGELPPELTAAALERLQAAGEVVLEEPPPDWPGAAEAGLAAGTLVYQAAAHRVEEELARRLRQRLHSPVSWESAATAGWPGPDDRGLASPSGAPEDPLEAGSPALAPEQREAVRQALIAPLLVITGGPGTGKTTTVRTLLQLMDRRGWRVLLAAPTGRAAQRLKEAAGREAHTVHRLLELTPEEGGRLRFARHEGRPLEADAVIVDEASMLDMLLTRHLLRALRPQTRLILVGDADQLPPVGPGQVLADLLGAGVVPSVRLTRIFRQASESHIVLNAHRIHAGELPVIPKGEYGDFYVVKVESREIVETVRSLVAERLPRAMGWDPRQDIQVLSPLNRGPCGVERLNEVLQAALNPPAPGGAELRAGGRLLRAGDRVMQTRNNYRKGVFNGDIGRIERVEPEAGRVWIRFAGLPGGSELLPYEGGELDELALAYAISVHKSQGSEFPVVVVALAPGPPSLTTRNLLYTAVTRGKRLVVLVGSPRQLAAYIRNDRAAWRYTALRWRLSGQAGHWPSAVAGPGSDVP